MRGLSVGTLPPVRPTVLSARFVYFSFHYQRDIRRIQQIKNHWVSKGSYLAAGFFDGSLEEKAKKDGQLAVKRAINKGMVGCSVTCVLIGAQTSTRKWVAYEVFRSIERGMGVFGITIHNVKDPVTGTDAPGASPFANLAYVTRLNSTKLWPCRYRPIGGWAEFPIADSVEPSVSEYLVPSATNHLMSKFRIYDWNANDGYNNFPSWVNAAATEAGR